MKLLLTGAIYNVGNENFAKVTVSMLYFDV